MTAFDKSWSVLKNIVPTSPSDPMGVQAIESAFCQQCKQGLSPGSPQCEECGPTICRARVFISPRNVMADGNVQSPGQQSMIERNRKIFESQPN